MTSWLYCSLIPCFHIPLLLSSGSLKSLHLLNLRRGEKVKQYKVFTTKKLVTFGTPLLSASFSLQDSPALDMEHLKLFFYHSPAVVLSPDASAVTFPLLCYSQFSPIFTSLPAGLRVLIHPLKHSLASTPSNLFFSSAAVPSGSSNVCLLCIDSGYCILLEGREKIMWQQNWAAVISWSLILAGSLVLPEHLRLHHCFLFFSAPVTSSLSHFLQVCNPITTALPLSRQSEEHSHPSLPPLSSHTETSATHV